MHNYHEVRDIQVAKLHQDVSTHNYIHDCLNQPPPDGNAPVHASMETTHWKQENNIKCMTWPFQSPDLKIIENVWRTINIRLQSRDLLI
jgi:hypothetical protein